MFKVLGRNIKLWIAAGGFYLLASVSLGAAEMSTEKLVIARSNLAPVVLAVEVANTPQSRSTGLMKRQRLALMSGMLFDFQKEQLVTMWMKNTYVSLDMFFIDKQGIIQKIVRRTKPQSMELIPSQIPVRAVLEVAAGFTDDHNIQVGDQVIYDIFSPIE